jgi:PAS domain S-box-containing protein
MVSSPGADSGSVPEARFYRLAMESLPDTVFVASGDGSIDWVCANVAPVFGPDPASVTESETVDSLLSPAFVDPLGPDERRLENQPITVTDADGVAHHYLVTVTRLVDDEAPGGADADAEETDAALVYACRDVTDVERLKGELDEVFERVTDGFVALDTSFVVTYVNDHAVELFGRPREELLGRELWSFTSDPEATRAFELLPEALETGEPLSYEAYFEPQDRWYEARVFPSETGLSVYFGDVTERVERQAELEASERRFRALFEGSLDALVLADDEGRYVDVNSAACELYGLPRDELLGKTAGDFAAPGFDFDAAWDAFLDAETMRGEFELVRPDGDTRVTDFAARANIRPGEHLSVLRDVTERVERERQLEVQRDELAHLNRINRLAREVNRAIVGADTPDEVLANVCRRLVDADVYRHAVVASGTAGGRYEVAAASGLSPAAAEAVVDGLGRELTTARRRVTSVIGPSSPEVRSSLDADVFGCFPLAYGGTVHGVLVIGAERSAETPVLVGEEGALLDDLGTTVGKAITAVTARRLLHADEVVSLEFAVDDADDVFNELSRELGARVAVTALVPMADGRHACYVTVEGTDSAGGGDDERLSETVCSPAAVDDCRVVSAEGPIRLEIHVDGGSPALALESQGTHVRTVSSTNGRGTLVVEIPTESNVRNLVASLVADYPDTRLVRKLTERRPGDGAGYIGGRPVPVSDERGETLTEKQLAALRAAHAGGYYDWPRRGSSAQELADALGVASATYHQHLRAAERKLVDAFFGA